MSVAPDGSPVWRWHQHYFLDINRKMIPRRDGKTPEEEKGKEKSTGNVGAPCKQAQAVAGALSGVAEAPSSQCDATFGGVVSPKTAWKSISLSIAKTPGDDVIKNTRTCYFKTRLSPWSRHSITRNTATSAWKIAPFATDRGDHSWTRWQEYVLRRRF